MSEFKIVKCKKCDAALTELQGERVTRCIQCGYKFNLDSKSEKSPHILSGQENFEKRSSAEKISKENVTPDFQGVLRKLKRISQSKAKKTSTSKNTKSAPEKKKPNLIGTIIFYIIFFSVLRSIFFN